jgi:hypothetical protein
MNTTQWVVAELDLRRLSDVRQNGQVLNHRDWSKQPALDKRLLVV